MTEFELIIGPPNPGGECQRRCRWTGKRSAGTGFSLGIREFYPRDFEANFFDKSGTALSNPFYLGMIGLRILRNYRIILDYQNSRVALIPTA